jgi:hypothetical protein
MKNKDPNALPMMVEGPVGTLLVAVGDKEAHQVAGDELRRIQETQKRFELGSMHNVYIHYRFIDT